MNTPRWYVTRRLAAFAAALAAIGGAAAAVGAATSGAPLRTAEEPMGGMAEAMPAPAANGLAATAAGLTFRPARDTLRPGVNEFRFRILDRGGAAVTDFTREGGVRLHLLVVRRDLTGYLHLHPRLGPDGSWSARLRLLRAGVYRAYADFERGGEKIVLGRDLFVPGAATRTPLPAPTGVARVAGYTVTLRHPELRAGVEAEFAFTVARDGEPVRDFEPYVGMRGHLVALHDGDLAFAHVHPRDAGTDGRIDFDADLASPGRYRLFLQFKHEGRVVTAPFTVEVRP